MANTNNIKRTPFYSIHKEIGARLIDFHGWEMPVQYSGIVEEHRCVREKAGIFDLSHMGEFSLRGDGALEFLQSLVTRNLENSVDGQAYYSCICLDNGGIIDDLIIYRNSFDDYLICVNASNIEKDFLWFEKHVPESIELRDISEETALIAVQGPVSEYIIQPLVNKPVKDLYFYHHRDNSIAGKPVMLARTGYTGEDGFEIYLKSEDAQEVWGAIWEAGQPLGMKPVGLGARDTLRLEMGYSLYGNELSEKVNPIEAGLGWVVTNKKPFISSEVIMPLKKSGAERIIAGFKMQGKGVPRQHYPVYVEGKTIGEVTSGTISPTLQTGIGMALIESGYAKTGTEISVEIRGTDCPAVIVPLPFVESKVYRKPKQ